MDITQALGQKILLAFHGKDKPSEEIKSALREYRASGVTLFRSMNIDSPAQVRHLTDQLQQLARELGLPPLLIATDQEGGQLMAIGSGTTPLPGNMALGATGSTDLARRAGEVLGRELAAMGLNVDYAPSVDVNVNPQNPVVGVRSFGGDAALVARLGAALVEGIQSQGVAATAKHFPGHGDTIGDSHHGLPAVLHTLERLQSLEFPPFEASIAAGVKMIMSAHLALPALDGPQAPPATLSGNILQNLLRRKLGFEGVIITDAMDMHAIRQGEFLGEDALRAVNAGADILLLTASPADQQRVYAALLRAAQTGALDQEEVQASAQRIAALKDWLAQNRTRPALHVIGCAEHMQVALEIARQSITLVRDGAHLLPLHPQPNQRIAVVMPRPVDLTPADTSSYIVPGLASALRVYHPNVDEFIIPYAPGDGDIMGLREQLSHYDILVIATLNAYNQPGQQAIVRVALETGLPTVVAALRLPYDLASFPEAPTYLCSYSILEPSMQALAETVFGYRQATGHLPVAIPGLYESGHSFQG
ncbi:MAG: glycoside hydrolase family 3 [Chloroflexi bacterium HGW-Chloroflexi-6]|nr:MAG: glycoside hydrolase family 3 [Chloroflexi bacterium HGW-Chloroflexi-6]